MKKLLEQLKKQVEPLENKCGKRDNLFDCKSEKWQDSDKGIRYQTKTEEMEDLLSSIEECIDSIETYLE